MDDDFCYCEGIIEQADETAAEGSKADLRQGPSAATTRPADASMQPAPKRRRTESG